MHDCHFWPVMFIPRFPLRFPGAAVLALALPGFAPAQTPPHVAPAPRPAPAAPVAPVAPAAVPAVNTEPAPTAASTEPAAAAQPVSLHALIISALEANLEIQSKRLDPLIQDSHVLTAWGAFDPVVSLSAMRESNQTVQNQQEFLSTGQITRIFDETNSRFSADLAGRAITGLSYDLVVHSAELKNTFNQQPNSLFNPEYQSDAMLTLMQPLLRDAGKATNLTEVRLGENAKRVSTQDFRAAVLQIVGQTMSAYFEAVFGQENLKVKQEAIDLAQNLVRENTRRVEEGSMAPIDVIQAQARLAEAREERILAENFLAQRRNTLRELTKGEFDFHAPAMDFVTADMQLPVPVLDRDALTADTLGRNPTYLSAIESAKAEDLRLAYAENQRWPRLDLKATFGYNGLADAYLSSFDDFSRRTQPDWSVGVVLSYPINNRAAEGHLAEARYRKTQAILNIKHTELQLLGALDSAVRDIESSQERAALGKDSVRLAESALDAEQKRLISGQTTSYNVLNLQKELSLARSRELATAVDLSKAIATLYLVQGVLAERMNIVVRAD